MRARPPGSYLGQAAIMELLAPIQSRVQADVGKFLQSRAWLEAAGRGARTADEADESFAREQIARFREVAAAFPGTGVELVDGRALTWYGPRIPAALAAFRELLDRAAA